MFRFLLPLSLLLLLNNALPAENFGEDAEEVNVYFGVGCFWHSQHAFVEAERRLLDRSDDQLTSRTGYAGGTSTDAEGRVCYHNPQHEAYYGTLGHAEVVGMSIPSSFLPEFALAYFAQFGPTGDRLDVNDVGPEYRSLMGLPGGMDHPQYPTIETLAASAGLSLVPGQGNDDDNFGSSSVYVMDSLQFPFYQAEVYHQFHNDFMTPPYGEDYNNLVKHAYMDGRLKDTGCPNDVLPDV